jgi:glucokinase
MDDSLYLSIDVGGTKTSSALFDSKGVLVDDYVFMAKSKTFEGEEAVYQTTRMAGQQVLDHFGIDSHSLRGIGVGAPGPLNSETGIIIHAPLMGWKNFPLVARLKEDFCCPVFLENDGNLGALAEQRAGMAKGLKNVIYMTISTGCGGGLVLNGQLYSGSHCGAGEVGHMSIEENGPDCPCGSKGCFELYASGTAMNRKMTEDMEKGQKSLVFDLVGHDKEKLNGKVLDQAARQGDAYALALFEREGEILGRGISILFNIIDPDAIVLGGGVTKSKEFFHPCLMKELRKRSVNEVRDDSVRYSVMNDKVVLYGAYYYLREKVDVD